jgi:uncharacterized protein (DUF58 family)
MPSGRGLLVFAAGIGLWIGARITGSATMHMIAVGLVVLPFAAALFARWSRLRLRVRRRLSETRVRPGQRVTVDLEVENLSPAATSFLLLEDGVPPSLGRPARLVLVGLRGKSRQRASYTLSSQRRGRYTLGPLSIDLADPFMLTRVRVEFAEREDVVVTPEVEDLLGGPNTPFGMSTGLAMARNLFRTGEEFYTMRSYVIGDDLRRIHWPSVARTGELMIRQDESTRRSNAVLFVDTREAAVGQVHAPAFEKTVSAAASVGVLLLRYGFSLKLATSQHPTQRVGEEHLLDVLAGASHHTARSLSPALTRLRSAGGGETTLAVVSAPPAPAELTSLVRTGAVFGPKVAVLVHPSDPSSLPPDRREQLESRATQAQLSLSRSGWEVVVLSPSERLADVWHAPKTQPLVPTG